MWKNFLSSIALLAIALMAALYSSSVSDEGRAAATGLSALLSLLLAIWVAIRFVPRLARNVDWKWVPGLSRYKISSDGWIFIAAVAVVGFAAINTSNNLLYMVLSALLAVLLLSAFLSALNLKRLQVELLLPSHCNINEAFSVSVRVQNHRRVFPMFSLRIEPAPGSPLHFGSHYFDAVEPLCTASLTSQAVLGHRGRYDIGSVMGVSRFPFGLFSKSLLSNVDATILCLPEILQQDDLNLFALDIRGEVQRSERGSGFDLYTIRDYQSADGARHVHWKASAKTASLKTREYAADQSRCVVLALDRFSRPEDSERFERLVSQAASIAYYLIHEGAEVTLLTDQWRSAGGNPRNLLQSILEYLATVESSPAAGLPDIDLQQGAMLLSLRHGQG